MPCAQPHVVFAGGGTGGHLFPGLAVAERLAAEGPPVRITFAGTGRPFERQHVAAAGFDYLPLPCRPWPKRFGEAIPFLLENLSGYRMAVWFVRQEQVQVVVGLGGYASVPMARAAAAMKRPLVLLEQNAVPGRATRWLARSATLVCTAFHQSHRHLPAHCHFRLTGNPIRAEFLAAKLYHAGKQCYAETPAQDLPLPLASQGQGVRGVDVPTAADANRSPSNDSRSVRQLLILGGSGGAKSLNDHVPAALAQLGSLLAGWQIVHQSGEPQWKATRQSYARLSLPAKVVPFLGDLPAVLLATDLAICRAGGTTLAELAGAGVPAVLLPYPQAADDHQRRNADLFADAGACAVLDEREASGQLAARLAMLLRPLMAGAARRQSMSAAIRRFAHPDAAWDVATLVRQLAR